MRNDPGLQPGDVLADIECDAMGKRLIHTDGITGQQTLYYYDGIRVILEKRKIGQTWQTKKFTLYRMVPSGI